jgi:hypothetical protein
MTGVLEVPKEVAVNLALAMCHERTWQACLPKVLERKQ